MSNAVVFSPEAEEPLAELYRYVAAAAAVAAVQGWSSETSL